MIRSAFGVGYDGHVAGGVALDERTTLVQLMSSPSSPEPEASGKDRTDP